MFCNHDSPLLSWGLFQDEEVVLLKGGTAFRRCERPSFRRDPFGLEFLGLSMYAHIHTPFMSSIVCLFCSRARTIVAILIFLASLNGVTDWNFFLFCFVQQECASDVSSQRKHICCTVG